LDFQLSQERQLLTVNIASSAAKAKSAAEPTIPHNGTKSILPFVQQFCDIKGLVAQTLIVDCPARSEDMVADHTAVNLRLIHTQSRDVQPSRLDTATQFKLTP
jgi:hypothetical protein